MKVKKVVSVMLAIGMLAIPLMAKSTLTVNANNSTSQSLEDVNLYDTTSMQIVGASSVAYASSHGMTAENVLDNSNSTIWHTEDNVTDAWITIDMGQQKKVSYFSAYPRKAADYGETTPNRFIKEFELYLGNTRPVYEGYNQGDGSYPMTNQTEFEDEKIGDFCFDNVSDGSWSSIKFGEKEGQYLTIHIKNAQEGGTCLNIAGINIGCPRTQDTEAQIQEEFDRIKSLFDIDKFGPYVDYDKLRLPGQKENELKPGYSVCIKKTSDEGIIDTDGNVTLCDKDKEVTLTYELKYTYAGKDVAKTEYKKTFKVLRQTTDADIEHFQAKKYGMFVHYVWDGHSTYKVTARTENGTKAQNVDEVIKNFDVDKFVNDCEEFEVQYVVFTAWHSGMNPLYPSKVFNDYRYYPEDNPYAEHGDDPDYDLIMKIAKGLKEKNIDLFLYFQPNEMHDFQPEEQAVYDFKGRGNPDFNFEKWNDYVTAQVSEMISRYKGYVKGVFSDETMADGTNYNFVDYPRLRNTIKSIDPSIVMMQNYYGTNYTLDLGMVEDCPQWRGNIHDFTTWPIYDMPYGARIGEGCREGYFMWWAEYARGANPGPILASAEDLFRMTVYNAGANTLGGGSCWAAGPFMGLNTENIWEDNVRETFLKIAEYMKPIEESVKNTVPSTAYKTESGIYVRDVNWGVATESMDGSKTFIHVLKPESSAINGKSINLGPVQDGTDFTNAKMLVSGKTAGLTRSGEDVILTLPDEEEWDELDTVFVLTDKQPADVTADDLAYVVDPDLTYDGTAKEAHVSAAEGVTGLGAITVKYYDTDGKLLTTVPVNAGTYTVKVDIAEGENYKPVNDLVLGTFTIKKAVQTAPTGLSAVAPTTVENNDGKILGTTTAMEYQLLGAGDWSAVAGTEIEGLKNGTYLVRFAENANFHASETTEVQVDAYAAEDPDDEDDGKNSGDENQGNTKPDGNTGTDGSPDKNQSGGKETYEAVQTGDIGNLRMPIIFGGVAVAAMIIVLRKRCK